VIDGLAVVDKPAGRTSHDVVARCRAIFGQRRVGHSGTLDPGATGVLLIGLGRVTRLLRYLTALPKAYEGEAVLGRATSTLDEHGEETGRWDMSQVGLDDVRAAARGFVGEVLQVPPMVSAVKVGGERLHRLARRGLEVERPARPVTVMRFDVGPGSTPGRFRIDVECSSGTYVRSLVADLGTALGGGAHLRGLRRTAIGSFTVAGARPLAALSAADVLTPAEALRDYGRIAVDAAIARLVSHGRPLDRAEVGDPPGPGPWAVVDPEGDLLAVYEADGTGQRLRPAVVLGPAG
jgi:tRNA pseudouridine55 synthase